MSQVRSRFAARFFKAGVAAVAVMPAHRSSRMISNKDLTPKVKLFDQL